MTTTAPAPSLLTVLSYAASNARTDVERHMRHRPEGDDRFGVERHLLPAWRLKLVELKLNVVAAEAAEAAELKRRGIA